MLSTILLGLAGGAITGLSPCILPVLPLVLAVTQGDRKRPWLVIAGMVVSFSVVTLAASAILSALHVPQDVLWWAGLILLVLVGLGMILPKFEEILEKPFAALPSAGGLQLKVRDKGGFLVGLVLGLVFVPCAGPVLAAISVAGSTGQVDARIAVLGVSFAVGVAAPLLAFGFAGQRIGQRVDSFQRHQKGIRAGAGAIVIASAVVIAAGVPAQIQRTIPDWTAPVQAKIGAHGSSASGDLEACRNGDRDDCGAVPQFAGLSNWINTDHPIDPATSGKVTLVDFWAYACINCQRSNTHVAALYDHYRDYGLEVVGIHAPEYSFEREPDNVARAVTTTGIHYPVALDNNFATWNNFHNRYWPAHYLVDNTGTVREVHEGEGHYAETEQKIRTLLKQRDPHVALPAPLDSQVNADDSVTSNRNPETYLGTQRARYFANPDYSPGVHRFDGATSALGQYALTGPWKLDPMSISPAGPGASLSLNYRAAWVQLVASGRGTVTVHHADGSSMRIDVTQDGTIDLVKGPQPVQETLTLDVPVGVDLHSFTFG